MDNLQNVEMTDRERFRAARNMALREFLCHHDFRRLPDVCWPWPKYKTNGDGYGCILYDGFKFAVHRLSFEHYKGQIPKGLVVMHACDNPSCFNPNHLFLGTQADNVHDMMRKGRHKPTHASASVSTDDPNLLKKVTGERDRASWAWRNPA